MLLMLAALSQPNGEQWVASWFPDDVIYPHYLADPRASIAGVRLQFPIRREDGLRIENSVAGHRSIFRLEGAGEAFELQAEAGTFVRFDFGNSSDLEAADYRIGFPLAYRKGNIAARLHAWHLTSHLGDEFIEREKRRRLEYERNEVGYGWSWKPSDEWRVYAEYGLGFGVGAPNERGRWQAGAEWVDDVLGDGAPRLYAAVNVTSFEEIDWEIMLAMQAGVWFQPVRTPRGFRVGLEYYRGRSAQTQFFQEREHYWSLAAWIHF